MSWYFYPVALVVIGSRQRAFSNALHESAHGLLVKNRRLNQFLGTFVSAYPILHTREAYRRTHVRHHARLGNPKLDPDLEYFIQCGVFASRDRLRLRLRLIWLPILGSQTPRRLASLLSVRCWNPAWRRTGSARDSRQVRGNLPHEGWRLAATWAVVAALSVYFGLWPQVLLFWLVPYLTVFQVLGWFIELSEHTGLGVPPDPALHMTRNRKSRGLELALTGTYADNFHLVHHLEPRIPFWNLGKAHRILLEDPAYALVDRQFGGLFTRGPAGEPKALTALLDALCDGKGLPAEDEDASILPLTPRRQR